MPGGSQSFDVSKAVEVTTVTLRNAYPEGLRRWGMRITVYADPTPSNNGTWVLAYDLQSTQLTDNSNWQKESDYVNNNLTTNTRYIEFAVPAHNAVTGASDPVVGPDDIADGEAVTIEFLWAGKDDDTNTGVGGLFLSTWTKAAGVLQKVADTEIVDHNDIGGTLTVSTSDSSGTIVLNVQLVSATGNFSYSGYVRLIFRKAS